MYRAKAKTVTQAVTRSTSGRFFSSEACYGTKLQRRLSFIEYAETTLDFREFCKTKRSLITRGSVRQAVLMGDYE